MKRVVIALGGNALGNTPKTQKELCLKTASSIIPIIEAGYEIIITHGNGPQVGQIKLAFEEASKINDHISDMPFSECSAMSQGYIGYHLQNALKNEFLKHNIQKEVVTVITQVVVDENDPAFLDPTKPIGAFYTLEEAKKKPFITKEDAGRGYRQVVPSPKPIDIVEAKIVIDLLEKKHLVISVGGGGIPVVLCDNVIRGVDAVIDKDFASSKLAEVVEADFFLILTAVDRVSLNYNKKNQRDLERIYLNDIDQLILEGQFAKGSMLPKIEAAKSFVSSKKGRIAIITSIENAYLGLLGKAGTRIIEGGDNEER